MKPTKAPMIFGTVIFAFVQLRGLSTSMFSFHPSRQTQTAWTIRTIARGGPIWRYETPTNGPPWSFPLELPTYQVVVAKLVAWFGLPLEPVARLVSTAFAVASLSLGLAVLRTLRRPAIERRTFALLFLLSPVISFWSHAISIQTTTMCVALLWVLGTLRWRLEGSRSWLLVAAAAGLAAPTKVTAMVPAYLFVLIVVLRDVAPRTTGWRELVVVAVRERFAGTVVAIATPLCAIAAWTSFTAKVFSEGGDDLRGLRNQVFGALSERTEFAHTGRVVLRTLNISVGSWLFVLVLLGFALVRRSPRSNLRAFGFQALLPFLLTPLLFFHLHLIHDYYTVETVVYFLFGLSAIATMVAEKGGEASCQASGNSPVVAAEHGPSRSRRIVAVWTVAAVVCISQYHRFYDRYDLTAVAFDPQLLAAVKQTTQSSEMLLIHHGFHDGSIGYQVDRRSMLLVTKEPEEIDAAIRRGAENSIPIGGLVLTGVRSEQYKRELTNRGFVRIGAWNEYEVWDF